MPLRDHFHPPLADFASWEELHGAWPGTIAFRLNTLLPGEYRSGVKVRLGTDVEIDVGAYDLNTAVEPGIERGPEASVAWSLERPTLLIESESPIPPEYEVLVYDMRHTRRLVAAVELVSPGNKDRTESRDAFVSNCHALLSQDVSVTIVDPVTDRLANLYAELAERLGASPPTCAPSPIYAVTCRALAHQRRWRVEQWEHVLKVGSPLPTLPLWLDLDLWVPLELERTYEETCRGLRIP